ncbi:hypothetical protein F5Y04DRAFT_277524 [Hypomontagnella monticulosa]|nr:hypothetical protein F5Y04DRAFT_277524 [Hypomontagnella monticulosa]
MNDGLSVKSRGEFPSGPGLLEPPLEFLDQAWSPLLFLTEDDDASVNHVSGEFVSIQRVVTDHAQQRAIQEKDKFTKILEEWDSQHDIEAEKTRNGKFGRLFKGRNSLTAQVRADISKQHSWEDVLKALCDAEKAYSNPTGIRVVHKWFRKAADKSGVAEPYIDFIPDTELTSVICGSLRFILKACAAANRWKEEAFDLINQLPEKVDVTARYSELYVGDARLQLATNELYVCILWAIEGLMYYLLKDHSLEFIKVLGLQAAYDPLKGRIQKVKKASEQVETAIKLCDSEKLVEISDGVDVVKQDIVALKNLFLKFMRAQFQTAKWFAQWQLYREQLTKGTQQDIKPIAYISQRELLLCLYRNTPINRSNYLGEESLKAMLQQVLRTGFSMDTAEQIRAEWLMEDKSVSRWFRSKQSRRLLVNSNYRLERVTPTSFFCTMLVKSLKSIDSIVVLSCFCGLDTGEKKPPHSSGLLKNLLTQLVEQWKFGELTCLCQTDAEKLKSSSKDLDLHDQKQLFRQLLAALPQQTPVFIVIDGINYYETSELSRETREVVKSINRLLLYDDVQAMIKVLVTSATRSFEVSDYFEDDEIVNMPEDMDRDTLSFSATQFESRFGSQVTNSRYIAS